MKLLLLLLASLAPLGLALPEGAAPGVIVVDPLVNQSITPGPSPILAPTSVYARQLDPNNNPPEFTPPGIAQQHIKCPLAYTLWCCINEDNPAPATTPKPGWDVRDYCSPSCPRGVCNEGTCAVGLTSAWCCLYWQIPGTTGSGEDIELYGISTCKRAPGT
ncbi:hypothetical protein NA57DRAFT_58045 [Rhizodiscina lignyota]|uniref:Uncharacterized protein n=1 Tax=Rhizodiscina lignyota TaxID=1504668 RepID=A0A9P4I943_9PEZI|nr:hypothetical protein NA57DRAFT_58045 [Rhizodiscina lignyota]